MKLYLWRRSDGKGNLSLTYSMGKSGIYGSGECSGKVSISRGEWVTGGFRAFLAGHTEKRFVKDVNDLDLELRNCGFSTNNKPSATKAEVTQGVQDLVASASADDVVVCYISTHGCDPSRHDGKLMLSLKDGLLDARTIMQPLQRLASQRVLILIHSCFAGAAAESLSPEPEDENQSMRQLLDYAIGQVRTRDERGHTCSLHSSTPHVT